MSSTVLGFDFGTQKIGVASGQSLTGTGSPLPALRCRDQAPDWAAIEALINEWQPDALVVGLPLNMDDSESPLSQQARRFARRLNGRFGKPVWMVDERLSTREAREQMGEHYRGGADPRVDSLAAALIIETYFSEGGAAPEPLQELASQATPSAGRAKQSLARQAPTSSDTDHRTSR